MFGFVLLKDYSHVKSENNLSNNVSHISVIYPLDHDTQNLTIKI